MMTYMGLNLEFILRICESEKGTDHARERPNGQGKNCNKDNKDDRNGSIR